MARSQNDHTLRNGIVATVVGGIALALLAKLWPPAMKALAWCWAKIVAAVGLFSNSYGVPGWVLGLLILSALPTALRFVRSLRTSEELPYLRYLEDTFYGAKWRWSWVSGNVANLWAFCPHCDSELVYDDSSCRQFMSTEHKTDFICEHCGHVRVATVLGGNLAYALSAIDREIRRKVRSNSIPTDDLDA